MWYLWSIFYFIYIFKVVRRFIIFDLFYFFNILLVLFIWNYRFIYFYFIFFIYFYFVFNNLNRILIFFIFYVNFLFIFYFDNFLFYFKKLGSGSTYTVFIGSGLRLSECLLGSGSVRVRLIMIKMLFDLILIRFDSNFDWVYLFLLFWCFFVFLLGICDWW